MKLFNSIIRYCQRCGHKVKREFFIKEYPYYCPECDENMYKIETLSSKDVKELKARGYFYEV